MRAMVYRGPYRIRVEDKPRPFIEHPNDAIVKVTRAAICGSDLHLYHGMMPDTRVGTTFSLDPWTGWPGDLCFAVISDRSGRAWRACWFVQLFHVWVSGLVPRAAGGRWLWCDRWSGGGAEHLCPQGGPLLGPGPVGG
jgi:hypothetical protein